ncbi:MAG TPA: AzlC family ABC transporter permease [Acidimicrobiales bacterium]
MRSMWRTLPAPLRRDIALVCLADAVVGLSYGAITVGAGFAVWLPVALSVVVLAGASQFLFVGIVAAGGSPLAAAAAGLVVNARHLPFGLAVADAIGPGWRRVVGSHLMNDESVAFTLAQPRRDLRRATYWVCGLAIALAWNGGVLVGALAGAAVRDTGALGLDAAFPAVLLALVLPALRERRTRQAAVTGGAVALAATPVFPAGVPVLLALVGIVPALRRGEVRAGGGATSGAGTEAGC